ncbi:MAG: response regulator [Pseudomonadota bacterium]
MDDDPSIRKVTSEMLEHLAYVVTSVSSGAEALDILAEQQFDLVLLDVAMPHMTGTEVYARMLESWPEQRVVFMTGYSAQVLDVPESSKVGLLAKPFSMKALSQAIEAVTA